MLFEIVLTMLSPNNQEGAMKTKFSLALFSLFVFLAGCISLRTGGEVQSGRQALLEGKNAAALGYFYSAAQKDPNYVYATCLLYTSDAADE